MYSCGLERLHKAIKRMPIKWWVGKRSTLALVAMLTGVGGLQTAHAAPVRGETIITTRSTVTYGPEGFTQTETVTSNTLTFRVQTIEALTLTQSQSIQRPAGASATLSHLLSNVGNTPSSYILNLAAKGIGCGVTTFDMSGLQIVRDTNNNGVVDPADTVLASGKPAVLTLQPGEIASLLVQGSLPNEVSGSACLTLSATTSLQGVSAANNDTVTMTSKAVLVLANAATYASLVLPGVSDITFTLNGASIGAQDVLPAALVAPSALPITVDGVPMALVLIRDLIPVGTRYNANSLQTSMAGALKLYRLRGDAPFAYRQGDGGADALEIAIGSTRPVTRNSTVAMTFTSRVNALFTGNIVNNVQGFLNDGDGPMQSTSNSVVVVSTPATVGLAMAASATHASPNGIADVKFTLRVKNYGTLALYNVQISDLLEGAGATQFGTYTAQPLPGTNQYTVLAGSLAQVINLNGTGTGAGAVLAVNAKFTGQGANANLLSAGAVLPVGAEATVAFVVRLNTSGRAAVLLNTAMASAALVANEAASITDVSTDGTNPDPDGYGDPGSASVPTPVSTLAPLLSMSQTSSLPRRISSGIYELDYVYKISNSGTLAAPNIRIYDNFNCTFNMDLASGRAASWTLVGIPQVQNGLLVPATTFSSATPCDRAALNADTPSLAVNLTLVDGSRALPPGKSETVKVTVRVIKQPTSSSQQRSVFSNKAWGVSMQANTMDQAGLTLAGASTSIDSLLIDPQGIVYNALTREPVAGAIVTVTRTACSASAVTPIVPAEIQNSGIAGLYTFNANGSLSMTTGSDGVYQFYFNSPPVVDVCTYDITAAPPAGSTYRSPSQLLPPQNGIFATCGSVVPNALAPTGSDLTTYYARVNAGLLPGTTNFCEVLYNHLPLDPGNPNGLILRKEGSKTQAEFGDFIDYALTVTNKTGVVLTTGLSLSDQLPPGLAYVPGSARLNGKSTPEPTGRTGPSLMFNYSSLVLGMNESATVHYRVRIGVGAPTEGDVINRAVANSGLMQSNTASFKTRVSGGVFSDEAYAFGKVYMKCARQGPDDTVPDESNTTDAPDEMGIPGVRLYLENGTYVVTDAQGKWSLYGLKPVTHVLRLDQTTLPLGAVLGVLDNRNSGTPESRFVDLKKGDFHKADFVVTNCEDTSVRADVDARRIAQAKRGDIEAEAHVRLRLDPENKTAVSSNGRALSGSNLASSGEVGGGSSANTPVSTALIELPASTQGAAAPSRVAQTGQLSGIFSTPLLTEPPAALAAVQPTGPKNTVLSEGIAGLTPASTEQPPAFESIPAPRTDTVPLEIAPLSSSSGPGVSDGLSTLSLAPASLATIELDKLLPELDNRWAFLGLADGDTVPSQVLNVRLKGEPEHTLRLSVNGEVIEERRVGMKAVLEAKKIEAWEYIGIILKPGLNTLQFDAVDGFGNSRFTQKIRLTAPDQLALIHINLPAIARADLRTPVVIGVRLTDAHGVPVTARTTVTLETDRGRWLETDINPIESGTQVVVEGGHAQLHLLAPGEPGDARVRVSAGRVSKEIRVALLPEVRPMLGVGIVEGVLDFTKRGALALGTMPAGAAFESELTGLNGDVGGARASARSAFFFKGTVKGDYLLTAAFDSDKSQNERMFRDIRPNEFYPVYGDASIRGFDAQSTQKLYVRIDKNRSYLLYGDFTTTSSAEVRQLSQSNRSLTGIKNVYEDGNVRATTYASRTAQTQQVEEFASVGTSGPYFLKASGTDLIVNSEVVSIVVRDRTQPGVVLSTTPAARFVDYTLEPYTRRVLFTHAISSVDANLNPQSIRISYEVNSGGPEFLVAGTDVQVKVNDQLQLGVVGSVDENPANKRKLGAVTALARLGASTTLASEVVKTETDLKGTGYAARVDMRQQTEQVAIAVQGLRTSEGFDNPGASTSAGRTDASARVEYLLQPGTTLRGEAVYGKTLNAPQQTRLAGSVLQKFSDTMLGEVGLNRGQSVGSSAGFNYGQTATYNGAVGGGAGSSGMDSSVGATAIASAAAGLTSSATPSVTTVRGRLTSDVPGITQAKVFVEAEQDVAHSDRHTVAVGGSYALTDKTRAYGRYEVVSKLADPAIALGAGQVHNTAILGVDSNYMEGGRVYNEYRLAEAGDARPLQTAVGVRNAVKLNKEVQVTGGIEQTRAIGGSVTGSTGTGTGVAGATGNSTAVISGAEYMTEQIKASGIAELRRGSDASTYLLSAGFGFKINADWSLLARTVLTDSQGQGTSAGNDRRLQRNQLGLALRPEGQDMWNALARYEHKTERVTSNGVNAVSSITTLGGASTPGSYSTDIVSAHLNVNPSSGNYITARYAGKVSRADDTILSSRYWAHLLQTRYTRDVAPDWDIGVQGGMLLGQGRALQKTLGLESGYQVARNTWVSVGYNFIGLSDRDLTSGDYTSKGLYIRLRFKFDETTLGLNSASHGPAKVDAKTSLATPALLSTQAMAAAQQTSPGAWTPGHALPVRVVFKESELFTASQSTLSPAGVLLLGQLGNELASQGVGEIQIVAYEPYSAIPDTPTLELSRAAAMRTALLAYGPRSVSISTDTRPPPRLVTPVGTSTAPALQIALMGSN